VHGEEGIGVRGQGGRSRVGSSRVVDVAVRYKEVVHIPKHDTGCLELLEQDCATRSIDDHGRESGVLFLPNGVYEARRSSPLRWQVSRPAR
jgi:hypothetical protein